MNCSDFQPHLLTFDTEFYTERFHFSERENVLDFRVVHLTLDDFVESEHTEQKMKLSFLGKKKEGEVMC